MTARLPFLFPVFGDDGQAPFGGAVPSRADGTRAQIIQQPFLIFNRSNLFVSCQRGLLSVNSRTLIRKNHPHMRTVRARGIEGFLFKIRSRLQFFSDLNKQKRNSR